MDKLFDIVLTVLFTVCLVVIVPVSACSNFDGASGGACSIVDLNKEYMAKKQKEVFGKFNLRPVKKEQKMTSIELLCTYSSCLLKFPSK